MSRGESGKAEGATGVCVLHLLTTAPVLTAPLQPTVPAQRGKAAFNASQSSETRPWQPHFALQKAGLTSQHWPGGDV